MTLRPTYQQLTDYSSLISPSEGKKILIADAGLDVTKGEILRIIRDNLQQVKALADHLKADTLEQSAFNVWHFLYTNVVYHIDVPGEEELRTPARTWADRFNPGVDCDDFTIISAALLINMGYSPVLNIVARNGANNFSHIFTTVGERPTANRMIKGYVIDPCPPLIRFDQLATNITKVMRIYGLTGVEENLNGQYPTILPSDAIYGLGAIAGPDAITRQMMKEQTRLLRIIKVNPKDQASRKELRKVRFIIQLNGTPERNKVLRFMPGVDDISRDGVLIFKTEEHLQAVDDYLSGAMTEDELNGWFKKAGDFLKKTAQKTKEAIKTVAQKTGTAIKDAAKKVASAAKSVGKAIVKYNPVTILARNGLLLVMKTNLFRFASRLKWGYATDGQAQKAKLNPGQWAKVKDVIRKIEKMYTAIGGESVNLKNAILSGGKGLDGIVDFRDAEPFNGITEQEALDGLNGLMGLGAIDPATMTAVAGFLAAIGGFVKGVDWKTLFAKSDKGVVPDADANAPTDPGGEDWQKDGFESKEAYEAFQKGAAESGAGSGIVDDAARSQMGTVVVVGGLALAAFFMLGSGKKSKS